MTKSSTSSKASSATLNETSEEYLAAVSLAGLLVWVFKDIAGLDAMPVVELSRQLLLALHTFLPTYGPQKGKANDAFSNALRLFKPEMIQIFLCVLSPEWNRDDVMVSGADAMKAIKAMLSDHHGTLASACAQPCTTQLKAIVKYLGGDPLKDSACTGDLPLDWAALSAHSHASSPPGPSSITGRKRTRDDDDDDVCEYGCADPEICNVVHGLPAPTVISVIYLEHERAMKETGCVIEDDPELCETPPLKMSSIEIVLPKPTRASTMRKERKPGKTVSPRDVFGPQ
ncbi:uncharacterized protein AMSG_07635 [Thecamonas trahens ATCC 50062]|uniref:Uncharacterized protein n=1 Tax=Thecamonas trahens ATCC 50062 TaxID=461836 RepID=A0A0L0DH25_THETB|nr:hypothetical protein AMSG_07635 [Thecamonas trahens ATCC 50062]KNC51441.1 hypothetical protein AMSG_07635 [Thecamonas trahens ATCC 50062]|eukprot:XP_013756104.1 hypothetical protein AMSG_07635 [Thecamonas trahens ATCC 50062]